MPKRNNLVEHSSEAIQGEDSFVRLRRLTWGEMKRRGWLTGRKNEDRKVSNEQAEDIFKYCIVAWNWVDDDGNPLPLPADNPAIIDELTDEESIFIMEKLFGSKVELAKKKTS